MEKDDTTIYSECEEIVDHVAELIGQRFRRSQIKIALREIDPNISYCTIQKIIALARRKIIATYGISPEQFKSEAIEFYSHIIREKKFPLRYRLQAQERLDKLIGLESFRVEDPQQFIEKINQTLKEMDATIGGLESQLSQEDQKKTECPIEQVNIKDPDEEVFQEIIKKQLVVDKTNGSLTS